MCRFLLSLVLTLGAAHAKVCRPGWTNSEDGQCFKAFSTPKSWRDAEAKCVSEGGHLAKIMNRQQQSTVLSLLDHQPWGIKLWIGGTEAAKAGEWRWTDGTLMTYTSWAPGMPRLGTGGTGKGSKWNGECTLMHGLHGANRCYDGGWYDSPCSGRAPFVCSEHGTPQTQFQGCPSGWQFSEGACFRGFCERKTWNDAQASCKAAGGNLAKISNCAHESTVRSLIGSATTLWIGLTEQGRPEGDWCWAGEKTSIKMRLWAKGEPNNFIGVDEECGAMGFGSDKDQSWYDAPCTCKLPYVCRKAPSKTGSATSAVKLSCPNEEEWQCGAEYDKKWQQHWKKKKEAEAAKADDDDDDDDYDDDKKYRRAHRGSPWIGLLFWLSVIFGGFVLGFYCCCHDTTRGCCPPHPTRCCRGGWFCRDTPEHGMQALELQEAPTVIRQTVVEGMPVSPEYVEVNTEARPPSYPTNP